MTRLLSNGVRPISEAQTTSVSSSRPRAFRSLSRSGDGLVDFLAVHGKAFLDVAVIVPAVAARAVQQLDEADAALHHAARQQTLAAEWLGHRIVEPVELPGGFGFAVTGPPAPAPCVCMRKASS